MNRFYTIVFTLISGFTFSQKDIPNAKDSELISRFPESWIIQYAQKDYERYIFALDNSYPKGKSRTIEGATTSIDYELPKGKSQFDLYKNYENAIKKMGFDILFSCYQADCNPVSGSISSVVYSLYQAQLLPKLAKNGNTYRKNNATYMVAEKTTGNKKITLVVASGFVAYANVYRLDIIESKNLDLEKVSVNTIEDELKEKGRIPLYGILFEFGKATILQESTEIIETVASYLKQNPKTSIYVVGHTDNVGDFNTNLKLSEERAKAVVQQLIANNGISSSRLEAKGISMLSPVVSNTTEEGRKLNRRVEIVKQ